MRAKATPLSLLLCYSMPAFVLAFAGMPLYIHAPDFYATEFSLSLSLLGGMLLVLRLTDAVLDLAMGHAMDRLSSLRLPIMLASLGMLGIGMLILFNPFAASPALSFFIGVLFATLAFSAISINLNSLGAHWQQGTANITRLTTLREACGLLGLIIAVTLPSILMQFMSKADSFSLTSLLLILSIAFAALAFRYWYRSTHHHFTTTSVSLPFWQRIHRLSNAKRRFFLVYGISIFASSIPAVLVLFFIRDRLGVEEHTGLFLLLYFLSGIIVMPLWQRLSVHIGISRSWAWSMLLACVSFVWASFLGTGDSVEYGIICILSGMAFGAELALPPALLTQLMQQETTETHSATYFALMAFLLKASMALAAALTLPMLELGGFVAGAENSSSALSLLSVTYALFPCALKAGAFLLIRGCHEKTFSS
jgi:GPH family glycoside/pentoside/hexuronide:cation symporter